MKTKIYHNPRCSKSRATLALLEERSADIEIVDYLNSPPTESEILELLTALNLEPIDIVRTNEPEFKDSGIGKDAPAQTLIKLITTAPKLLQRPIVVVGGRARIGRPPEQVLELLE